MPGENQTTWQVEVESYSGYKAEEHPRRFRLGSHLLQVIEILDRWYDPDAAYFKVRASDGNRYILKNREGQWTLESFQRSRSASQLEN